MPFFFFQAEDGIRDSSVTGVQTCALPICLLLRPKSPCRLGTLHMAIETASVQVARLDCTERQDSRSAERFGTSQFWAVNGQPAPYRPSSGSNRSRWEPTGVLTIFPGPQL